MTKEHALAILESATAERHIILGFHPYTVIVDLTIPNRAGLIVKLFYDIIETHTNLSLQKAAEIISTKFNI